MGHLLILIDAIYLRRKKTNLDMRIHLVDLSISVPATLYVVNFIQIFLINEFDNLHANNL